MLNHTSYNMRLAVCGIGVLLMGVAGCHRSTNGPAAAENSNNPSSATRVSVGKPQRKTLFAKTTQPARIEAFEETPLFSKIAGYVEDVHVDIGDKIIKDQTLVTLRVPELADDVTQKAALVTQAEAQLKQSEANIVAAKAAADTATAKIAEARATTTRAAGEYERWNSEYERVQELAGKGSVTQKLADETLNQFRAAQAAKEAAAAAVQSAEAAARQAQANVASAEADRVAADAHLGVAKAELARAKTMFDYTMIRSPYDGVVTRRSVDTGHFVQPAANGAMPLLIVARTDKVRVFVEVPEMEAAGVDVGEPALIHVQAAAGGDIKGEVTRTSWSLDPANRSLRAEVDIRNEGARLRPGTYATCTIETARRENAITIPTTAIVRDGNNTFCCVLEKGKIVRLPIQLGIRSGADVEVLSGISEENQIVLVHPESLTTGELAEASEPLK